MPKINGKKHYNTTNIDLPKTFSKDVKMGRNTKQKVY
jgi:hypothetical protein